MAIAALAEARLALTGALRLARADPRGLTYFDLSEDGFWRSFRAAALCYPLYLILLAFPIQVGDTVVEVDVGRYFAVETIHYAISWVAFPLLILPVADRLGRGDRYFAFIVAFNWCQVPQTVVFAVITLLGGAGVLSAYGVLTADLFAGVAALVYKWYIARVALAVNGPWAALVIVVDLILATVLSHVTASLY